MAVGAGANWYRKIQSERKIAHKNQNDRDIGLMRRA